MAQKTPNVHQSEESSKPSTSPSSAKKEVTSTITSTKQTTASASTICPGCRIRLSKPEDGSPSPPAMEKPASSGPASSVAKDSAVWDVIVIVAVWHAVSQSDRRLTAGVRGGQSILDMDLFDAYPEKREEEAKKSAQAVGRVVNLAAGRGGSLAPSLRLRKPLPSDDSSSKERQHSQSSAREQQSSSTPHCRQPDRGKRHIPVKKRKAASQATSTNGQSQAATPQPQPSSQQKSREPAR